MKRTRRNHGAAFKTQVAFAAVKGEKTLAELATQFGVHPTQITEWKQQLLTQAVDVFAGRRRPPWTRPLFRLTVEPFPPNGLLQTSQIMIDKIVTVPQDTIGVRIGSLDRDIMVRADRSLAVFLGIV